jgi:hypothetical protein
VPGADRRVRSIGVIRHRSRAELRDSGHASWQSLHGMPGDEREPTPDPSLKTGSSGYQSDSEETPTFSEVPEGEPPEERIDPYQAFADVASKVRKEKEREKEKRQPAIWLPGEDDLDQENALADQETKFSGDGWRGRGNPQVGVRLRPSDFERLSRAAEIYGVRRTTFARMMIIRGVNAVLDAELRRDGEFLRERWDRS